MAIRLRVQERMGQMKASELQTKLTILLGDSVYPATVRRYIYGTKDGTPGGEPLKMIDLELLVAIATVLHVEVGDLITGELETESGPFVPAELEQLGIAA